jgi:putative MATE family efflux protein
MVRADRAATLDREILALAVPAFFTLIAEPLYVLADTAVVGHLGTPQLAGVAAATTILVTGYSLCIFLAMGTTAAVARLLGAGQREAAAHAAVQALWLGVAIGIPLALLGLAFTEPLLSLIGVEDTARTYAYEYFRISLLGVPALLVALASVGYLRGSKRVWIPLTVAVTSNVVNLVLELVLIYGLGYGVGASALATVVVQLGRHRCMRWSSCAAVVEGAGMRPDRHAIRSAGSDGWLLFLRTLFLRGAFFVLTAATAPRRDRARRAADRDADLDAARALTRLARGCRADARGEALGGGLAARAHLAARRTLRWGTGVGFAAALLVLALHNVLPYIFTDDPAVISLASFLLVWVAISQPLGGPAFVLDGILVGSGDLLPRRACAISAHLIVGEPIVLWLGGIGWLWAVPTSSWRPCPRARAQDGEQRWAVTGNACH